MNEPGGRESTPFPGPPSADRGDDGTVSVIIPTFNGGAFIRETIASVLAQTSPPLEVIVCDDGSTDDTPRLLRGLDARVRVLEQTNRGVSAARNLGAHHATGRYLAFLDHDDLWEPDFLATQVAALRADRRLGLVYSDSWIIDSNGRSHGTRSRFLQYRDGNVFRDLLRGNFIPIETMLVPSDVFRSIGRFDETLRYCEDFDLCLRITRRHPVRFDRRPLARYRIHDRNLTHDREKLVAEWLLILQRLVQEPDLAGAERIIVGEELARRHLDAAWHAMRRGDLASADAAIARSPGARDLRLAARVRAARIALGMVPSGWRSRLMQWLPHKRTYGVPTARDRQRATP